MVTVESVAHGIAEIAQQVEPVGHLDRLRSAGANAVGIGAGPVAGDDLDAGMRLQPGGDGLGTAVGQQVDRPVGTLQIDDNGAVAPAAAPGPVIDADDARRRRRFDRNGPDQTQQGVAADRHGEQARQAGSQFTARAQRQGTLDLGEPDGAPLAERHRRGQALGEDPARAARLRAAEAADLEGQRDDAAHQGKVGDTADVAAVNPSRRHGAYRTAGDQVSGSGMHGDEPGTDLDTVNGEPVRQQGQQGFGDQEQCKLRGIWFPLYERGFNGLMSDFI